jgi:hypothetical protein
MLVPLYASLQGDTIVLLILVQDFETVRDLGIKMQEASAVRVNVNKPLQVFFQGKLLNADLTVTDAGLTPLDYVQLVPEQNSSAGQHS